MAEKINKLTYHDYTITIICPLEVEMSATRYMLDEEHAKLQGKGNDRKRYISAGKAGRPQYSHRLVASRVAGYQSSGHGCPRHKENLHFCQTELAGGNGRRNTYYKEWHSPR